MKFQGWKTANGKAFVLVTVKEFHHSNGVCYEVRLSDGSQFLYREDGTTEGIDPGYFLVAPDANPDTNPDANRMEGVRHNSGKLRYDLESPFAREAGVRSLTRNAKENGGKYESRNWERGLPFTAVIASLERHLAEIKKGNNKDGDEGFHHENLLVNAQMLAHYFELYSQYERFDDRPYKQEAS